MRAEQLSLLGHEEPCIADGFATLRRTSLDADSWFDHAPGFVAGHAVLFEALRVSIRWHHERRMMYEREVDVPRLVASVPKDGGSHPLLRHIQSVLSARYAANFESIGLALYRDGNDSVAWHRDKLPRDRATLVATVSLGSPRRFMLRPFGGGASTTLSLGWGDLLVMGGACQTNWEHCVPKLQHAQPRLSLMFRHVY